MDVAVISKSHKHAFHSSFMLFLIEIEDSNIRNSYLYRILILILVLLGPNSILIRN